MGHAVEVRFLADVVAVEDLDGRSRTASSEPSASQLIVVAEIRGAIDQPEVTRVEIVEEAFSPELFEERLVLTQRTRDSG